MANRLYPRFASRRLVEALEDSPVVLIHGPRQCGKTTLARAVGDPAGYLYYDFDLPATREAARVDPVGFVADLPKKVTWDQDRLAAMATRIREAGDDPTQYLEIAYRVPERRFGVWPDAMRNGFAAARSESTGKPVFRLETRDR